MIGVGLLLGATFAAGIAMVVAVLQGWQPPRLGTVVVARAHLMGAAAWKAIAVAVVVAAVTRWPIAAAAAGAITWMWPSMFGAAADARSHLDRVEAVTVWTESLRDTMAAAVGLEQAIIATADVAPAPIQPELQRLVGRLRAHVPVPVALATFGDELDDASVDLVVAALIMNARLRGSGLVGTLTALANTARRELEMRTRVEETRKGLRRNARTIVAVTLVFAGALMLLSRAYLEPYGTVAGQLMLAIVVALFLAGFVWIRNASRPTPPGRFLVTPAQVAADVKASA